MDAAVVDAQEGRARVRLPSGERAARGPGAKEAAPVFYNPAMAVNRDLSSLAVCALAEDGWSVLDGLAASGVRGLRYALESGKALQVEWNDWNPLACRLVEENCRLNGVEPHVTQRNVAPLLYESVWNVVDLDPYGSPSALLDPAGRAVRDRGLLGVTATDTTALAGVYPRVCERRYLATPMHTELMHEVALRILVGACVRQAAKHEVALRPVLAHATDHYYRVLLAARRGASRVDGALASVGPVHHCRACGEHGFSDARACGACGGALVRAGPAWTGPLADPAALAAMEEKTAAFPFASPDSPRLLDLLRREAEAPPLFFDLHEMGSRARVGSPPTEPVIEALRSAGHRVAPVHFNRLGIRTSASAAELLAIVRSTAAATR